MNKSLDENKDAPSVAHNLFPTALSIVAYSPLGNPRRPWAKPKDPVIVKDKLLRQIGAKFGGKTAAQIALKYSVRHPHSMAKGNLNKNKTKNYHSIKAYELRDYYKQKTKSSFSNQNLL